MSRAKKCKHISDVIILTIWVHACLKPYTLCRSSYSSKKKLPFFWFLSFSAKIDLTNTSNKPIIFQIIHNIGEIRYILSMSLFLISDPLLNHEKPLQTRKPEMI